MTSWSRTRVTRRRNGRMPRARRNSRQTSKPAVRPQQIADEDLRSLLSLNGTDVTLPTAGLFGDRGGLRA
jgi:hypothetical protein